MTNTPAVSLTDLGKTFVVPEREPGLLAAARSLLHRRTRVVSAVAELSLRVWPGEIVGFLGANGAGKTTAMKLLSGLLHPTSGQALVLGHVPARRQREYLRRITLVMGNRYQLQWDLPAADSFELNQAIYQIPSTRFRATRNELVELLEIGDLIRKPVRNLSLGERMKVELAGSLLHLPEVLFLDEPTLGLDVTMQRRIRSFLLEYNRRHGATILLTSHYMADIEALCRRVVVLHRGRTLFDGALSALAASTTDREVRLTLAEPGVDLSGYGEVRRVDGAQVTLRVPRTSTPAIITQVLTQHTVVDLTVADPPVEDVIEAVFLSGRVPGALV